MGSVAERLKLLRYSYAANAVKVMVLRDAGSVRIGEDSLTLAKGTEVELPRWAAVRLSELGIAKFKEEPLTIEDVARVHYNEMNVRSPMQLGKLPEGFYQRARDYISQLERGLKETADPALFREKMRAEVMLKEIIEKRISMIMQLVMSSNAAVHVIERLTPEERVLYNELRTAVEEWKALVAPYLRGA